MAGVSTRRPFAMKHALFRARGHDYLRAPRNDPRCCRYCWRLDSSGVRWTCSAFSPESNGLPPRRYCTSAIAVPIPSWTFALFGRLATQNHRATRCSSGASIWSSRGRCRRGWRCRFERSIAHSGNTPKPSSGSAPWQVVQPACNGRRRDEEQPWISPHRVGRLDRRGCRLGG